MTLKIKVYSDYVCPFCFLGEKPLQEAIQGKDVEVEWMPFELRPYPAERIDPWNEPDKLGMFQSTIMPWAEQMGVDMKLPRLSPHPYTHTAFEGYQFAKEYGKGNEYQHRVFTAFFQEERNIGEIEVLVEIAGEVGLNQEAFRAALENHTYKAAHEKAVHHAYYEQGVQAVPTFIIGNSVVQGVRDKKTLEAVIEQELKKETTTLSEGMTCNIDGCE
ncbi:DSBA-like thioredoxin domain protein [Bacillus pseudomycoides]|uniref:DsbA family oxidoreductase n=1 Tax=Bacillus TaxID=1386 RepID=UPI00037A9D11|nr:MULTISPECIES: DsbA family oxidoreductase [Bacillus]AIK36574.1 DSBA-like thioredoxin domain protein [Bacillus pseudomycoides]AJI19371.1 DSBA-like thioredoxin domain protein [Bacillus pseudomycoides]